MRRLIGLAILAAGMAAQPAAAMTAGQANCPVELAPKTLGPMLIQEMLTYKEGQVKNRAIVDVVMQVLTACLKREKVSAAHTDAYTKYVISRISHDELARQLGAMNVPTAMLDRAFGLGPGLANPRPDQITDDQYNTLVPELNKAGVKFESLPQNAANMMGAYVAVTGEMYRGMAVVR